MSKFDVDAMYSAACRGLPSHLRELAQELAYHLKLTPCRGVPWSAVFTNEVTLQAPAMFREALLGVSDQTLQMAVTAHMLAVIEAFGTDRIADGQVEARDDVRQLLGALRAIRDQILVGLCRDVLPEDEVRQRCHSADEMTQSAIRSERTLLASSGSITFGTYAQLSLAKQSVGFPATNLLAHCVGLHEQEVLRIDATLGSIWLALQIEDDVVDWEDDLQNGGAWAVALARGLRQPELLADASALRGAVLASGVLETMLDLAQRQYRAACRRASLLGAWRLAAWARERERKTAALVAGERKGPGYARRLQKLAPWAAQVLP